MIKIIKNFIKKVYKLYLYYFKTHDWIDEISHIVEDKYLISWYAINNDTYEETKINVTVDKLPKDIKIFVYSKYDGVWEACFDTIKTYKLIESKNIMDKRLIENVLEDYLNALYRCGTTEQQGEVSEAIKELNKEE